MDGWINNKKNKVQLLQPNHTTLKGPCEICPHGVKCAFVGGGSVKGRLVRIFRLARLGYPARQITVH